MRQPSNRKRAKRLIKTLKEAQDNDTGITPPTVFAIKHLLQHHPRSKFVEVKIDSQAANFPITSCRSLLPHFIVSQLEEQRLTERKSEKVLVPPIVAIVIKSLPSVAGNEKLYPTLFRWHHAPCHRTYYIFAHIKYAMPRRTYTLTELFGLRECGLPKELLAIAGNIADIARRTGSEASSAPARKLGTVRHKDDSSVTSDEVVYKGTVNRRMGRELAREATQNSARPPTRDSTQGNAREPVQDPSRPMEWKYRGRSDNEATTIEPIPAPTGVPAQRDEGFQRFYKAVVSPTHVRVTAGGRIVPNTRGPPSPTVKRTIENPVMENQSMPDKALPPRQPGLAPIGPGQPQVPVMQQLYPPGFQSIQTPVSFVQMALGAHLPPGFSFAQSGVNSHALASAPENTLKDTLNKSGDAQGYATDSQQGKVKTEAFDYTKPYFYNGQLIYPVGTFPAHMGNPIVPVQMVGVPHGVHPQLSGQFMQPQPTPTAPAAPASSYPPSNTSLSGIPPVVNHIVPANANLNATSAPPVSSIKLSDITKKQISSFKQSLKYHEDQLQFNRHQIDEKDMEMKIHTIKGHIQRFELTLKSQLEYEDAQIQASQGNGVKKPAQPVSADENQPAAQPTALVEHQVSVAPRDTDDTIHRRMALSNGGLNSNLNESSRAMFRSPIDAVFPGYNALPNGPSIPSDAALAPIFQPRGYASTWTGSKYAKELKAYEEAEKRILATASHPMGHMAPVEHRSVSQPYATTAPPHAGGPTNVAGNTSRPGSSAGTQQRNNLGVPYLLGTLPKGVNPRTARDQDYVYKRPLTEEERRARFLYWGRAPKSAVRGLPKFDGKHFYPASPVKEPTVDPIAAAEYRKTDSDCDPFRPVTPMPREDTRGLSASEDNCTVGRLARSISYETQVNSGSEDVLGSGTSLDCQESSGDFGHSGLGDRRSENPGYGPAVDGRSDVLTAQHSAKLWETVLKKGPSSSALSSTTAHGFLPQYAGNAAASFGPSLSTNQATSPREAAQAKLPDVHDMGENGAMVRTTPEKRENCPPNGVSALEDQFKNLSVDVAARHNLTSAFGM